MSILGQIANPQMADIAGALDYRQKRLDAEEQKRKQIRIGQLVAEAIPNLKEGSTLHQLATESPQDFALFAKAAGIPLNSGQQFQQLSDDVSLLYTTAQADPYAAIETAQQLKAQRNEQGRETPQLDKWLATVEKDPATAFTGLFTMHRALNAGQEKDSEFGKIDPSDFTPESMAKYEKTKNKADLVRVDRGEEKTSSQKDFEEYQRLLKEDPEAAETFGRQAGFLSREGQELSSYAEKRLGEANDEAVQSASAYRNYLGLAEDFMTSDAAGGTAAQWSERLKGITGSEDAVSRMRQEYRQIRNTEAVKNLPPGVASDKDIELALSGFPQDTANAEYIASFMRGMAKLAKARAEYNEFKAEYISDKGTERGFLDAWRSQVDSSPAASGVQQNKAIGAPKFLGFEGE